MNIEQETEIQSVDHGTLINLNRAEIDQQISTAKRYPRSLQAFRNQSLQMVTMTEAIAKECVYALSRRSNDGNKVIEGPSARFGEIIAHAWGNCRTGARVVSDEGDFVTAQGVFHDLERNVAITYEVKRRIIDKNGRRYSADMVGVTANAACSIAMRNAILKGVPKAFWSELYAAARKTIAGDLKTLNNRRGDAIKEFAIFGVSEAQILAALGKTGVPDITIDDLVTLHGMLTALKDGDSTPEDMFGQAAEKRTIAEPQRKSDKSAPAPSQQQQPEGKSQPEQVEAQAKGADGPVTEANIKLIKAKLVAASIPEDSLTIAFGVDTINDLKQSQVKEVLEWTKTYGK